ncbi:MAG: hypothetical protein Q8P50_15345 [Bacillota bacterium]|nr:hypothetical protein [Bacillota bacterium]
MSVPLRASSVPKDRLGYRQVVRLGQYDTVEHSIDQPIAASVQAMAHRSRGGASRGATPA